MLRLNRYAMVIAGLVTTAVVGWLMVRPTASLPEVAPRSGSDAPATQEPRSMTQTPAAASAPVFVSSAAAPVKPFTDSMSNLAVRVDGWAHSAAPQDAMRAYEAVADCLKARAEDRIPQDQLEAGDMALASVVGTERMQVLQATRHHAADRCQDLRSDQVESRLAWLRRAAAAGLPGAALAFEIEGPDGQGALGGSVSSLLASNAWYEERDAYIAQGLQHCDRTLAAHLAVAARAPGVTVDQAMRFWFGKLQCADGTEPPPMPLLDDPSAVEYLRHMGRGEPIAPAGG